MCILSLGHDFVSSIHVLPTLSYRHQKQHRAGYYQYPDLRMTDSEGRSVCNIGSNRSPVTSTNFLQSFQSQVSILIHLSLLYSSEHSDYV